MNRIDLPPPSFPRIPPSIPTNNDPEEPQYIPPINANIPLLINQDDADIAWQNQLLEMNALEPGENNNNNGNNNGGGNDSSGDGEEEYLYSLFAEFERRMQVTLERLYLRG